MEQERKRSQTPKENNIHVYGMLHSWTLERIQKIRWSGEIFFCCDGIFVHHGWSPRARSRNNYTPGTVSVLPLIFSF